MTKYVSKPVEVDAIQFTGGNESAREVLNWLSKHGGGSVTHTMPAPGGVRFETVREHITIDFADYFTELVVTPGEYMFVYMGDPVHWDGQYFERKFNKIED